MTVRDDVHGMMQAPPEDDDGGVLKNGWCAYLKLTATKLFLCTPTNVLLVFVPLAVVAVWCEMGEGKVFVVALLGLIPLAERISFVTEDLAK